MKIAALLAEAGGYEVADACYAGECLGFGAHSHAEAGDFGETSCCESGLSVASAALPDCYAHCQRDHILESAC